MRVEHALSESLLRGLCCGRWELPVFSSTFFLLLRKRFGDFRCNLCMHKNATRAPTQKTTSEKGCHRAHSLASTVVSHSIVPAGCEGQGLLGPSL